MTGNTRLVITSSRSVMYIVSNTLFDDVYVLMYFIQEDVYIVNEYYYQLSTVFPFFYTHLFKKGKLETDLNSILQFRLKFVNSVQREPLNLVKLMFSKCHSSIAIDMSVKAPQITN